jgi:hypothetical protein
MFPNEAQQQVREEPGPGFADFRILASSERAPESRINGHRVPDEYTAALDNWSGPAFVQIETDAPDRTDATAV